MAENDDTLLGGSAPDTVTAPKPKAEKKAGPGTFQVSVPELGGKAFECKAKDEDDARRQFLEACHGLRGDYTLSIVRV